MIYNRLAALIFLSVSVPTPPRLPPPACEFDRDLDDAVKQTDVEFEDLLRVEVPDDVLPE